MVCKICFKDFSLTMPRRLIECQTHICDECFNKLTGSLSIDKINGTKIMFLSKYDGLYKQMLMNYKEYGDYELRDCFLYPYLKLIKLYFNNYYFVPLPSTSNRIKNRGFNHLIEILKISNLKYLDLLYKINDINQKELNAFNRINNNTIEIKDNKEIIENKKIVLFDDVYTTGSTFNHSLNVIKKYNPKKIKGLIIMRNIYQISN